MGLDLTDLFAGSTDEDIMAEAQERMLKSDLGHTWWHFSEWISEQRVAT